jgi:hypothetical protein
VIAPPISDTYVVQNDTIDLKFPEPVQSPVKKNGREQLLSFESTDDESDVNSVGHEIIKVAKVTQITRDTKKMQQIDIEMSSDSESVQIIQQVETVQNAGPTILMDSENLKYLPEVVLDDSELEFERVIKGVVNKTKIIKFFFELFTQNLIRVK